MQRSGKSQAEPRTRVRAHAKISAQSSEAKPDDQTASPAAMEISGTGELSGLRGEGDFESQFEKGYDGTLEYWFE